MKPTNDLHYSPSSRIVSENLPKEFDRIPAERLMDFIVMEPPITRGDKAILDSWEGHFRLKRVPYRIADGYGKRVLWKERRA